MIRTLFTCLLFLSLGASALNSPPYPRYRQVVLYFFDHYSAANRTENQVFKFEKRPAGWFVTVIDYYAEIPVIKEACLWSSETGAFRMDTAFAAKKEQEDNVAERLPHLDNWEAPHYDACPYFGYRGWDWDVCETYTELNELPDTVLYGVGRAYSSCASNMLNDNSGMGDETRRFRLQPGFNALNSEQLEQYRKYRRKAIEAFTILSKRNPDFETLVGSIQVKSFNEHLTGLLELRMYQNETEAIKELPENNYNAFYLSLAKNYLGTCAPNAILFVNGDTDTYPLLYVQIRQKFRQDVTVVNCSLLQTERYIDHLRQGVPGSEPLRFSFSGEDISGSRGEFVILQADSLRELELGKAMRFIQDPGNILTFNEVSYSYLNTKRLTTDLRRKKLRWTLPFDNYLLRSHLMMLDLVATYKNTRPIYFALTLSDELYLGLEHHLELEGFAYRLQKKAYIKNPEDNPPVATKPMYRNLLHRFYWEGHNQVGRLDAPVVQNYSRQFYWLAASLANSGEQKKSIDVLDKYFALFPNSVHPYDYYTLDLMEIYYRNGESEKANAIGRQLVDNINQHRVHQPSLFNRSDESEYKRYSLEKLHAFAETYGQQDFYKDLLEK